VRTLKEVKMGETVTVRGLMGEGALKRRIMDMGITKGTEVYVRKVAPLGDPVEVRVRGYELSIRKQDAELITVNDLPEDDISEEGVAADSGAKQDLAPKQDVGCGCGCEHNEAATSDANATAQLTSAEPNLATEVAAATIAEGE
jgi:ferrous iron transport protein A